MKVLYLIIVSIVILLLLVMRAQYNERKAGVPAGMVKVCSPTQPKDCEYVDEKIVNTVYAQALALANADTAVIFPIESLDEAAAYSFSPAQLNTIRATAASALAIDVADCEDTLDSVEALILSLSNCLKTKIR